MSEKMQYTSCMALSKNQVCPCPNHKTFKGCCGSSLQKTEDLYLSVHETGHVLTLPHSIRPHVSLQQGPCALCPEGEREEFSDAHTGYEVEWEARNVADEILYSLAGGAAEIACGLKPAMISNDFGIFPVGMSDDLSRLRNELGLELWRDHVPQLRILFQVVVEHFSEHCSLVHQIAMELRNKRRLGPDNLTPWPINREALLERVAASKICNAISGGNR